MEDYNLTNVDILVVDENVFMRKLVTGILREFNFHNIQLATNSEDAIHYFQHNSVDLVFSNWGPEAGEVAFLQQVRNYKESAHPFVPIIILSAFTEEKYVKLARDLGMNEFLALPISARQVYNHICEVIENPREFIHAPNFCGPDRRRRQGKYRGEERRVAVALDA